MIRKAIIVLLTLAAIGTVVLWLKVSIGPSTGWTTEPHWGGFGLLPTMSSPPRVHVYGDFAGFAIDLGRFRSFRSGYVVIPFWAVSLLLSIYPTVAAVRGPVRRYRRHRRIIATISFLLSLIAVYYLLVLAFHALWKGRDGSTMLGRFLGSEAIALAGLLAFPLGVSYVVARAVFSKLGRSPDHVFPCCKNCGYNLTGNVSGVCPECGTPI